MNRIKIYLFKYFVGLFIIIVIFLCLYDNYSKNEITSLAYVIALGIDKGETKNLKISVQFSSNVKKEQENNSNSGSSQSSSSSIVSVESDTLDSGINLLNSYVSRKINFSHCKIIIISEELAKIDISEYLLYLCNNPEVSSHANFMISKCNAKDFLENSNPVLEAFSARYYEIAPFSYKYTGFTKATSLIEFFSDYLDDAKQPTAILGNINNYETHEKKDDSFYVSGQTPISSENKIETMGLAVFKDGKYINELNGLESICHLIITNKLDNANIQIKNPKIIDKNNNNDDNNNSNYNNLIDLNIVSSKSKIKVKIINDIPNIEIKIKFKIRINSIYNNISMTNIDDIKLLEDSFNNYMSKEINNYLNLISTEYKSDIDGFGNYAKINFFNLQEWKNYKWLDNFDKSIFKVNIKTDINSGYKFISK